MRPCRISDIEWLEPIAKEFSEWQSMLRVLTNCLGAWVIEPFCIYAIMKDDHGACFVGLTSRSGVKQFIKLGRAVLANADLSGVELHGHWKPGSWQASLAEHHGFRFDGSMYRRKGD